MARRTVSEHHAKLIANTAAYEVGMARAVAATKAAEGRIASSGRGMGFAFQQVGFQVQDFAVQVAGGQGALRAFAQQAPQLLGIFGPLGALAGAAVSVGALVAQIAMASDSSGDLKTEAKQAAEAAKKLADELERVAEARARVNDAAGGLVGSEISRRPIDEQIALSDDRERFLREQMDRAQNMSLLRSGQSNSESRPIEERLALASESRALQAESLRYQALLLQQIEKRKGLVSEVDKIDEAAAEKRYNAEVAAAEKIAEIQEKRAFDALGVYEQIELLTRRQEGLFRRGDLEAIAEAEGLIDKITGLRASALTDEVSSAIQEIYGGLTGPRAAAAMPEIPVNSYQRRGLSLDADGGASAASQRQEEQTDLLRSIDGTLKAARRSGVITWQTN